MSISTHSVPKAANILLALTLFLLPIEVKICSYTLGGVLLLLVIYSFNHPISVKINFRDRVNLLPALLFLLMAISILYSHDKSSGLTYLSRQASLLIIPIIAFLLKDKINNRLLFTGSTLGSISAIVLCAAHAYNGYKIDHVEDHFYYVAYSYLIHPTYFSIILSCNIFFLLGELSFTKPMWYRCYTHATIFIFIVNIIILNSRMATLVFIAAWTIYFFLQWFSGAGKRTLAWRFMVYSVVIAAGIFWMLNHYNRISGMVSSAPEQTLITPATSIGKALSLNTDTLEPSNLELRKSLWISALQLFINKPFTGYGIGDVNKVLTEYYKEHGMLYAAMREYNPHNQFLQILLSVGILGFVVFAAYIILCLIVARSFNDVTYFVSVFILAANAMAESILQHAYGIIFFMLITIMTTHGHHKQRNLFSN